MRFSFGIFTRSVSASPLNALTLSANQIDNTATTGAVVGAVLGLTPGSAWALTSAGGGSFAKSGDTVVTTGALTNGAYSLQFTETLAGAAGSPRTTTLVVIVVTPGAADPLVIDADDLVIDADTLTISVA